MKRLLVLYVLACLAPAAMAGTATFGLFSHYGKCGSCSACPGPWNAFSPTNCCAVENANGCTLYPSGYYGDPYIAGGFPVGYGPGHRCGLFGCGFLGHHRHAGYGWNAGMPYPCGAVAAFHGMPGMGGCADPFSGCGMLYKPTLKDHVKSHVHAFLNPRTSAPPKHLWDYFHGSFHGGHLGGFVSHETMIGGGCENCDAPYTEHLALPTIAPSVPMLPTAPLTTPAMVSPVLTQPVSYQMPVGYFPMPLNNGSGYGYGYYPAQSYGYGYYPAQSYGYGYYPAYSYGFGSGYPMGW